LLNYKPSNDCTIIPKPVSNDKTFQYKTRLICDLRVYPI